MTEKNREYGLEMLRMLMEKNFSEATITTAVGICRHKSKEPMKAFKAVRDYLMENPEVEEKVVWRYLQDEVRGKY